ncbi:hypothetical protein AXF42_Ash002801 [Apostasia shenzhenica]|uniref:Uncharacterized protein n=1 Tax=Apostasia shenzhenica TaxID=1088818 RepID=A0A2I0A7B8_9ASPA|nr:hypothetical protein AXF42_Ash002801 [Apostasia shenzhenica]
MIVRVLPLPSPICSHTLSLRTAPLPVPFWICSGRRFCRSTAASGSGDSAEVSGRKWANLVAQRKEKIKLPEYIDGHGRAFCFSEFLRQQSGVEALLNTRALQGFESLGSNAYRCTLQKIRFLNFEVAPVLDLRVIPTREYCTVEMISCKFNGSEAMKRQNDHFSAFMRNHITWEVHCSEPFLEVDVNLSVSLEVYTKPFSLLPVSAVETPGNLLMQGLMDRLVPLFADQLLKDYGTWVEQQLQLFS